MSPRGQQGRALAKYLQREVRAYSAFYRPALERAFRERAGRSGIDIEALPLTARADIDDPTTLVLRPEYATISRYGAPALGARVLWARVTGRMPSLNRTVIDPAYKPIHWTDEDGLLVGSSSADLDRLSELGRRWLEVAGIRPNDVLVSVLAPGPRLAFWELVLGARRAGLTTMFLGPDAAADDVLGLRPTVLVGAADDLERLLAEATDDEGLQEIRTVLVVGEPPDEERRTTLMTGLPDPEAVVLYAWAPAGARALWAECRGRAGLHTWPDEEVVEVVGGEVVWTAVGWYGTALVRLRTGVQGAFDRSPCPGCGRTTPRLLVGARAVEARLTAPAPPPEQKPPPPEKKAPARRSRRATPAPPPPVPPAPSVDERVAVEAATVDVDRPPFAAALDGHSGVVDWQAELRVVDGTEELLVFLATTQDGHPGPVLQDLVRSFSVTQFVVLAPDVLAARRDEYDGQQIVDLRQPVPA